MELFFHFHLCIFKPICKVEADGSKPDSPNLTLSTLNLCKFPERQRLRKTNEMKWQKSDWNFYSAETSNPITMTFVPRDSRFFSGRTVTATWCDPVERSENPRKKAAITTKHLFIPGRLWFTPLR